MGTLFTLTDDVLSIVQTAFDDLITELGKTCRLVYPSRMVACPDCQADVAGSTSSNHWISGGVSRLADGGTCPLCNGVGRRAQEVTEDIVMLCAFEPKHFFYPVQGLDIRVPYSIVQTKCYLTDLPKLERADHLLFEMNVEGIARRPYKLFGEPCTPSNIVRGRYVVATWQRAG